MRLNRSLARTATICCIIGTMMSILLAWLFAILSPLDELDFKFMQFDDDSREYLAHQNGYSLFELDGDPVVLLYQVADLPIDVHKAESLSHLPLPRGIQARASFGWPLPAMQWIIANDGRVIRGVAVGEKVSSIRTPNGLVNYNAVMPKTLLPTKPLWPWLMINVLLWTIVIGVVMECIKVCRFRVRLLRGRCPECGYDLRGAAESGCSECGWRRIKQ
jgi:hypothetical protein